MIIPDEKLLDDFRTFGRCDVCDYVGAREPHHIVKRGMDGGSRMDIRINLLATCRDCHRRIEDARPIERGPYRGAALREADQFWLVSHRDKIPVDVDLQAVVWMIDRLPKDARPWQFDRAAATLSAEEKALAVEMIDRRAA